MRTDGKTPKKLLYVVSQKDEEEKLMKIAFERGINSTQDQKVDEMVESIIMKKSIGKV